MWWDGMGQGVVCGVSEGNVNYKQFSASKARWSNVGLNRLRAERLALLNAKTGDPYTPFVWL